MRHLTFILILSAAMSCTTNVQRLPDPNASLLTGSIHLDSMPGNLLLATYGLIPEEYNSTLIKIDSSGNFKLPINIEYPQSVTLILNNSFSMMSGNKAIGIFIFPGDTLKIELSDTINITARDKQHQEYCQNYLKLMILLKKARSEFPFQELVQNDSPDDFLLKQAAFNNQLENLIRSFLTENKINDQEFNKMAMREAEYINSCHILDYKWLNQIIYHKDIEVPGNFFSMADALFNTDGELIVTQNYIDFLNRYQMKYPPDKIDSLLKLVDYNPRTLTQQILFARCLVSILNKDSIRIVTKYLDSYKPGITNRIIKQKLDEQYKTRLAFLRNPSAGSAFLTDLSLKSTGNPVLKEICEKHKNKVIYIKFWGPWCGPCMEELPYDKMLIKEIDPSDFSFVTLCVRTKKTDWEYTISSKKMPGYHYLLNDDQYNELSALYNINGIPYHILIGKNGKIINSNAPGPGSAILGGLDQSLVSDLKRLTKPD